jgi:hypothetical protein
MLAKTRHGILHAFVAVLNNEFVRIHERGRSFRDYEGHQRGMSTPQSIAIRLRIANQTVQSGPSTLQETANMSRPETAANGRGNGVLSPKQEAAAFALARGLGLHEASEESGAGERTIRTWTASLPAFSLRVGQLRAEMTSRALGRLADGMASAAETLGYLSRMGKSEMVRLSAARAVLELGTKLRETVELEERIAALEEGRHERRRTA